MSYAPFPKNQAPESQESIVKKYLCMSNIDTASCLLVIFFLSDLSLMLPTRMQWRVKDEQAIQLIIKQRAVHSSILIVTRLFAFDRNVRCTLSWQEYNCMAASDSEDNQRWEVTHKRIPTNLVVRKITLCIVQKEGIESWTI